MSLDLTDDKSTVVQVMAWCSQATSHYLSQCWLRSMSPYGVTGPEWVDPWIYALRWRRNGHDSVSNHHPRDCLLNRLFRHRSKKISKPRVTGLCAGNSPETGEFPAQMGSNAENFSIWWRHHGQGLTCVEFFSENKTYLYFLSFLKTKKPRWGRQLKSFLWEGEDPFTCTVYMYIFVSDDLVMTFLKDSLFWTIFLFWSEFH